MGAKAAVAMLPASRLPSLCSACLRTFRPNPKPCLRMRYGPRSRPFTTSKPSPSDALSATIDPQSSTTSSSNDNDTPPPPPGKHIRVVPASPSYFTTKPASTDGLLKLKSVLRKYEHLPVVPADQAIRIFWEDLASYRSIVGEPVRAIEYSEALLVLRRLSLIHPQLMPDEVRSAMEPYKRAADPNAIVLRPKTLDGDGRAYAIGRRKTCTARVYLVEGDGQVLVNGSPLNEAFDRVHDRESAIWPLKVTGRVNKYNIWAQAYGGGTTGRAEAITLAVARALMIHEPLLKPALRRAGCIRTDPRQVERKKPGKLKARKMPAWVKR